VSPVVLKAMKKGNLKSFVSGERSRALWALLFLSIPNGYKTMFFMEQLHNSSKFGIFLLR